MNFFNLFKQETSSWDFSNIESTKVTAVTSNNTKIVYSFDGNPNCKENNITPTRVDTSNYKPKEAAEYAYEKSKPKSQGKCATFVWQAMAYGGGFTEIGSGVNNKRIRPISACVYAKHMQHWGFVKVYEGKSGDDLNGFTPRNGDIAVIAGKDFYTYHNVGDSHGHIQIYCKGVWCSDYQDKDA